MLLALDDLDRETAVAAVRALETELFGCHAWSERAIRDELAAPARTYLFDVPDAVGGQGRAIAASDVRGFAGYWYDGDDAEIMDVGVGKAHQRQGIALGLMRAMIDRARLEGARRMLLEVAVDNEPAIALYERLGFERIGLRRRYYQPEGIDAHVMALELAPHPVGFAVPQRANDEQTN
ncbi:ribosomal- protein-alanine acetyl transferase [Bifidobacterium sp. DSM 109958]|uniref:Ribosomal- protein-alanine acetyl transferase n=1 Tax=Bifidobacterium moraviense TaxID=2675323 RepID=A0A7Y0HZ46_9BIFI|nr:ribosomal protein S18-alanine N-acetyltransferase [Bifidobacterium sp. DSM 109958]NMM99829.1 ribosomal- protein-alanine acetyl transferase [Bifidobacterium sp. DSM 109958]